MTRGPSKTIEETNAVFAAISKAEHLYNNDPDAYVYPAGSNRDESRLCNEISMSKSNQVMASVLDEAKGYVNGDRNDDYGDPVENHTRTAEVWNWYLKHCGGRVDAVDVCQLNDLQKTSRLLHCRKRDGFVDKAGFAANAAACAASEVLVNGT